MDGWMDGWMDDRMTKADSNMGGCSNQLEMKDPGSVRDLLTE
jgi:hypothetical protein